MKEKYHHISLSFLSPQLERDSVSSTYTENDRSMLKYLYDSVFFIVRKPADQLINGDQTQKDGQFEDSLHTENMEEKAT